MTITSNKDPNFIEMDVSNPTNRINAQKLTDGAEKHQSPYYKGWYIANSLDSISRANTDPFLPIFASSIGATAGQIGLLSGLYSLVNISQLLWAQISTKMKRNRIFVVLGWFISAILYIPIALLRIGQIYLLIILRFLQGLITSASIPTQASLMADHISYKDRAKKINHFTELRLIGALLGTLISGLLFSLLADNFHLNTHNTFIVLFLWTMLLSITASLLIFMSVPDYPYITRVESPIFIQKQIIHSESPSKKRLKAKFTAYLNKFSNFWVFCLFAVIFYFGVYLAATFFIILEIEKYHLSFFAASILTSVQIFIQILLTLVIAKQDLLDKFGRKIALVIGVIFISISSVLIIVPYYFLVPTFLWCLIAVISLGIGWGLFQTALAVFLLDITHPQYKATLIAVYNAVTGVAMFFGPVFGGLISEYSQNISLIFLVRSLIIILTVIILMKVKEPEIPGIMIHPIRSFFWKLIQVNASKGSEFILTHANPRKVQYKHWIFKRCKQK
ncbi:MAG: MFS transporter [Candidatus Hodarchaeota archaeon]